MPFLSERTLVEVRGYDTNKCREEEAETLVRVISDLPDYCTLVFVMDTAFEPDGRLKTTKAFKKNGQLVQFTAQGSLRSCSGSANTLLRTGKTSRPRMRASLSSLPAAS